MNKKTTIYDIAREAGVSTATVTRVVRKDPHVKEATRLKVQQVIDAHAYSPSISAQNLEGGRSCTLAVVLPVISNLYFNRIFDAAWWEAEKNGCSLRLFQTMENQAISPEIVSELIRCRMDGVLFAGSIWSEDRGDLNTALEKLGQLRPRHGIIHRAYQDVGQDPRGPVVQVLPPESHPPEIVRGHKAAWCG